MAAETGLPGQVGSINPIHEIPLVLRFVIGQDGVGEFVGAVARASGKLPSSGALGELMAQSVERELGVRHSQLGIDDSGFEFYGWRFAGSQISRVELFGLPG